MGLIRDLQENQLWNIPYGFHYQGNKLRYSDMQHALTHISKSIGILYGMIDKADRGDCDAFQDDFEIRKRVADLVICALRIANTDPNGKFDLENAVIARICQVNDLEVNEFFDLIQFNIPIDKSN